MAGNRNGGMTMSSYSQSIARPPRVLTEREALQVLKVTGQWKDGYRDHVLYSTALATALREHELVALDVGDVFDPALERARRHVRLRVFKRASQDPPPQEVVLPDLVRSKIEKLVAARRRDGEVITAGAPLFVSRNHRRLSTRQVRRAFALWQARAGLDRRLSFHALRHTACTGVYRRTKDIRLTQRFARHWSLLSTMIYTHPSDDDLVRVAQTLIC